MTYPEKDTEQLHRELRELRQRVAYLEARDSEQKWVAEALVQSEAKFRELTEKSVVGVYVIQGGVFKYVNPKLAGIFGYEIDELVGKMGPEALVLPEDWPMVDRNLRQRISGAVDAVRSQFRGVTKTGEIVYVEAYGSRTDHEGHPAVIGTLLDITESVRAKKDVDNEIKKFQALYDLALAMTAERTLEENLSLIVDKSRDLLSADKAFIALRDDEAGDLYMHTLSGIVTDEFKKVRIPLGTGLGGKVAETGQWHIVQDYFQEVGPWFHDVVRAEGLMSGIAVPVQIAGHNLGVLYVFNRTKTPFSKSDLDTLSLLGNLAAVEITRKRVQQQLQENHESFRKLYEESKRREDLYVSLLNSSADAIVIYDMEGRAQHVSPSFTRIFGWTFQEVEGRRIPFVPEAEMEPSMVIIRGIISDGTPCSGFETKRFT
ncbi:MAG: PAS domain S-box protein, partial [Deltaproteobacteria bacterium]|nr:PAS domain S-box protein [Deltaproteobacteria bacterium]